MTPKKWFQIISIWVSKNAEFDADFESVKKVVKNIPRKKVITYEHESVGIMYFFSFHLSVPVLCTKLLSPTTFFV
jgi:hypothetical protein